MYFVKFLLRNIRNVTLRCCSYNRDVQILTLFNDLCIFSTGLLSHTGRISVTGFQLGLRISWPSLLARNQGIELHSDSICKAYTDCLGGILTVFLCCWAFYIIRLAETNIQAVIFLALS